MKLAFIETSAINYCYDNNIDAQALRQKLQKMNLAPVVGIYTTFELAACASKNLAKASGLFRFIKELCPEFGYRSDLFCRMEIENLKNNSLIEPLIKDAFLLTELQQRIENYANGIFAKEQINFIATRRAQTAACRTYWSPTDQAKYDGIKHFDDCLKHFLIDITTNNSKLATVEQIIQLITPEPIARDIILKLVNDLNLYPALRTFIYHHLYLDFVTEKLLRSAPHPKEDKFTDGLQIIEAAYCTALISADDGLIDPHCKSLNPAMQAMHIKNL